METAQDALDLAAQHFNSGDLAQCEVTARRLLARDPHDAAALHRLALVGVAQGRLNFAIELLRQAVLIEADEPQYHFALAVALNRAGDSTASLRHFRRTAELQPTHQEAMVNVGALLDRMGEPKQALPWFQRAVTLDPRCAVAQFDLGNVLLALGDTTSAIAAFDEALKIKPDWPLAHWNKALGHLLLGQFEAGWHEYAWRIAAGEVVVDKYPQRLWHGEPLDGKTILVHAEQGIGDEVLFASCLPNLITQARQVLVVCEPRLERLLRRSFPTAIVHGYSRRKDCGPFVVSGAVDYQVPMGDLPRYFRNSWNSFPVRSRFLIPNEELVLEWRERFAALGTGPNGRLNVGISWQAGGKPTERRRRSTTLDQWLPLLRTAGVRFINLQYGETHDELAAAQKQFGVRIHDWTEADPLVDLDGFAAKLAALDLVITVGNATAHLAGAIGTPTWALLPSVPGWRWLLDGETNPWYCGMRSIRQPQSGDWKSVFNTASTRLRMLVASSARDDRVTDQKESGTEITQVTSRVKQAMNSHAATAPPFEHSFPKFPSNAIAFDLQKSLDRAIELVRAQDWPAAEPVLNEVLAHAPRNRTALECLSRLAEQTGRMELALRSLTRAAAVETHNRSIWIELGRLQHVNGQFAEATASYRHLLSLDALDFDAAFGLANSLHAQGNSRDAVAAYQQAARMQPTHAKVQNFLGAVLLDENRLDDAEQAFRTAITLVPHYAAAWNNLACTLRTLGRTTEARHCFEQALIIEPGNQGARANLNSLLEDSQHLAATISLPQPLTDVVTLRESKLPAGNRAAIASSAIEATVQETPNDALPQSLQQRLHVAGLLFNEERFAEAGAIANEILTQHPNHTLSLRIAGVAARRAKDLDAAARLLQQATQLAPQSHVLWFELGVVHLDANSHQKAHDCFARCIELQPTFQAAAINLSGILEQQERYEESIPWARRAMELKPDCHLAYYNLANALRECGQIEMAIEHYNRALQINPGYVRADWNLGICHLHLGNYQQGWPRYENRVTAEEVAIDHYTQPRWNGESLSGKTIVVHAEQGLGDEIVFCSCIPELVARAGRVIIVCDLRLEKLFRRSFPQCAVHGWARRKDWSPMTFTEPVDYQIPMGSLPLFLRPTRESFPQRESFLLPDAALTAQWRERFATLGTGVKVGVSWRAGGKPLERRKRSTPIELWAPLFNVAGVHFINLQYGDSLDDAAEVRKQFGVQLHDWEQGDPLVDVDSFAAKVAALDLVISVGNATVHTAGGVGTPAWTLLPMVPSWRWMVAGDISPWYTSVRLFRQPRRNDWRPVFDQLGRMLAELSSAPETEHRRRAMVVHSPLRSKVSCQAVVSKAEVSWLGSSEFSVKATVESIPDLMKQAEACVERGELQIAESLYREILLTAPRYPSALQGLSRVARRLGKTELAIRSIKRALATAEAVPARRCDLAGALADAERSGEAIESYRRAIELDPKIYLAHYELGLLLSKLQRYDEALLSFETAARLQPASAEPLVARAATLRAMCRVDQAIEQLEEAIAIDPANIRLYISLAEVLCEDHRFDEATVLLRQALTRNPQDAGLRFTLGRVHEQATSYDDAAACYERALLIDPHHYAAWTHLGTIENERCKPTAAERCFREALKLRPDVRELHNSLGVTLVEQGQLLQAIECYDRAIALADADVYAIARTNRAFAKLQLGRYAEGWIDYEHRWHAIDTGRPPVNVAEVWEGSALEDKTILIHGEQGIGDEIMFASCYQHIIQQARKVVITCEPRLERLFRRSFPAALVLSVVRGLEHNWKLPARLGVDLQIAAGSLPMYLRRVATDFPRQQQFVTPDAALADVWRRRLFEWGPELKIGISWRAGEKAKDRRLRTMRLQQWLPILQTPGVQFVNVQHGDCRAELAELQSRGITIQNWPDVDNRNDLDGLAARISALDLVISAGNANVHLAGSLGVPCWSLLPAHGGWRWPLDASETLWYRSVRLFRQSRLHDWDSAIVRVRQELLDWVSRQDEKNSKPPLRAPHWAKVEYRNSNDEAISKGKAS